MKVVTDKSIALTVSVSEVKARCLELIEQVEKTQCTIVVTKHGKPHVILSPYINRSS